MTLDNLRRNSHVDIILQSGMILDEDMEFILLKYRKHEEFKQRYELTLMQKILGTISIAATLFVLKMKLNVSFTIPITLSPFFLVAAGKLHDLYLKRKRLHNTEALVDSMCKSLKLHRQINEYLKLRDDSSSSMLTVYNPYTQMIEEFVEIVYENEVQVLTAFKDVITMFSLKIDSLQHYSYVQEIEFDQFFISDLNNIKECLSFFKKLYDIYILLGSHFLTCLVTAMSPKTQFDISELLDNIVPRMRSVIITSCNNISRNFDNVKYYYLQKNEIKKRKTKPETSALSKLHVATCNTMLRSGDILEKSSIILKKLEEMNLQTPTEQEILGQCINELKTNVYNYYESLDLLHSLYEISINKPKLEITEKTPPKIDNSSNVREINDASLNPVEPSDDEEYELYIGPNDTFDEINFSYLEQDNHKFASLLSQELKQKLKMHARFVAARNKSGILDEEADSQEKQASTSEVNVQETEADEEFVKCDRVALPPPLPPPLPFEGQDILPPETNLYISPQSGNFLESIVNASKIRNNVEDVFGDSDSDCESDLID